MRVVSMTELNLLTIERNLPSAVKSSSPVSRCWGHIVQSYSGYCNQTVDKHGFSVLVHLAFAKGLNNIFEADQILNVNIARIVKLLSVLEKKLMPLIFLLYERLKFYDRVRGSEEPVLTYLTCLVCLAESCEFDADKDHQIKEQFLNCGNLGTSLKEKILCEPDVNTNRLFWQLGELRDSADLVNCVNNKTLSLNKYDSAVSYEATKELFLEKYETESHRDKSIHCEMPEGPKQKTVTSPKRQLRPSYPRPKISVQNTDILQTTVLAKQNQDKFPRALADVLSCTEKTKNYDNSVLNACACIYCQKLYPTEDELNTHMKSHVCVCELCGMKFTFHHQISNHLQDHNELSKVRQISHQHRNSRQSYICPICQKRFDGKRKFNCHLTRHCNLEYRRNDMDRRTGIKPHECQHCSRSFSRKWDLKIHQRTHDPQRKKEHVCDFCGKEFFRIFELIRHQKLHTGDKSYTCEICGKAFTTASYLNGHRFLHTGVKQHTCDVCGKSFSQKNNLVSHMAVHSQTKDHRCELCNKEFSRKCYLKPHMKAHLKEKPFGCGVCGARFGYKFSLNRHLLIHGGTKPFECILCGKAFLWESTYKSHRRHHEGT